MGHGVRKKKVFYKGRLEPSSKELAWIDPELLERLKVKKCTDF